MGIATTSVTITAEPWPWQDPEADNVPEDIREAVGKILQYPGSGYADFLDPSEHPDMDLDAPRLIIEIYEVQGGSYRYVTEGEDPDAYALHEALAAHGIPHEISDEGSYEYAGSEHRWEPSDEGGRWMDERRVLPMGEVAMTWDPSWDELPDAELGAKVRAYFDR